MTSGRRFSSNSFELGIFSSNVAGGLAQTKVPIWDGSWDKNVTVAQRAEAADIEFLLPLGRWRGARSEYASASGEVGDAYETLTWASGILALTGRIAVFGTLHIAYVNPVFAAKQVVTAHHIGHGRFGLNVVSGSFAKEYDMFGIAFPDHDARYDYTDEWVAIVKRLWSEREPFDHLGRHFTLRSVVAEPKPFGGRSPFLISAGASARARAFALRNADALFTTITNLETFAEELQRARSGSPGGARLPIYASGHLICRPTRREADEYYHHLVYELGDWSGMEEAVDAKLASRRTIPYRDLQRLREQMISGGGTYAVRGSYDEVARQFADLHAMGLDGMALGLVDYIEDFSALRDEILPRLERLGLRRPRGRG